MRFQIRFAINEATGGHFAQIVPHNISIAVNPCKEVMQKTLRYHSKIIRIKITGYKDIY